MYKVNYLIRLDDACPTMHKKNWLKIEEILTHFNIKPMVGIIPDNKDKEMFFDDFDPSFWEKVKNWQRKYWTIAMHGYEHIYWTKNGGINPINKRSEFAGLPLEEQKKKIEKGVSILKENGFDVNYFFPPGHTFDNNTLIAIASNSTIKMISDTIAFHPYGSNGLFFLPQQFGHFMKVKVPGHWTFCFHPNTMNDKALDDFERFIEQNHKKFISFDQIDLKSIKPKTEADKILSMLYFTKRTIWGLLKRRVNLP